MVDQPHPNHPSALETSMISHARPRTQTTAIAIIRTMSRIVLVMFGSLVELEALKTSQASHEWMNADERPGPRLSLL
ncbi:hypothetical protein EV561_1669 [Rhizobium sp. BK376]|nr:hypothetical protein EV561_1669 [Rhizobium sp. BK376]